MASPAPVELPAPAPIKAGLNGVVGLAKPLADAMSYSVDLLQRSLLFMDVLRQRGDNMLAHERAGQSPLLDFEHEVVLDARQFERPANYALLRITRCGPTHASNFEHQDLRPVMVVDPRAGPGQGIGGFKHDSEVGVALHLGHPTYFAIFFPERCPGQTLADVIHALRAFTEEVMRRHGGMSPVLKPPSVGFDTAPAKPGGGVSGAVSGAGK